MPCSSSLHPAKPICPRTTRYDRHQKRKPFIVAHSSVTARVYIMPFSAVALICGRWLVGVQARRVRCTAWCIGRLCTSDCLLLRLGRRTRHVFRTFSFNFRSTSERVPGISSRVVLRHPSTGGDSISGPGLGLFHGRSSLLSLLCPMGG